MCVEKTARKETVASVQCGERGRRREPGSRLSLSLPDAGPVWGRGSTKVTKEMKQE